jgi:hypothetical protein
MTLDAVANGLSAPSSYHPDVSGVVVDIPAQGGFATVVALTDGTTSMYTSVGGGTIGAGEHSVVRIATRRLLAAVQRELGFFVEVDTDALPPPGLVRFHLLAPHGRRYRDVPEDSFWGRAPDDLMPVIEKTQELISAISNVSPT